MPFKKIIIKSKKRKEKKIKNKSKNGKLKKFGYDTKSNFKNRIIALKKAIQIYGISQVLYMLHVPGIMLKNRSPDKSIILFNDYNYLKHKYNQ